MKELKQVDTNIRKEVHYFDAGPEMEIKVFTHKENFGNNGDKFLVVLYAESQGFMVGDKHNDENYDLPLLEDQNFISFVVVGNREISALIAGFHSFITKNE